MNNPQQQSWCVMGLPGDTTSAVYGQKWPNLKNLAEWHPADQLKTGYYLLMVLGYQGEFRQGEGRQPMVRGGCILRVGNPPEPVKVDYSKLTANEMQPRLQEYVEGVFSSNYRDITARKTMEWGKAQKLDNGNWQPLQVRGDDLEQGQDHPGQALHLHARRWICGSEGRQSAASDCQIIETCRDQCSQIGLVPDSQKDGASIPRLMVEQACSLLAGA